MSAATLVPEEEDFTTISDGIIEKRIIHVLTVWPILNPSMLQVGIGTAISPKMWHPILAKLEAEGRVVRSEISGKGPTDRDQTFTRLQLAPKE